MSERFDSSLSFVCAWFNRLFKVGWNETSYNHAYP